jgi:hypothetical protein
MNLEKNGMYIGEFKNGFLNSEGTKYEMLPLNFVDLENHNNYFKGFWENNNFIYGEFKNQDKDGKITFAKYKEGGTWNCIYCEIDGVKSKGNVVDNIGE